MSVNYNGAPGVYLRGFAKCLGCNTCVEFALPITDLPVAPTDRTLVPESWTLRDDAPWCERCSASLARRERAAREREEREKAAADRALAALAERGGYR